MRRGLIKKPITDKNGKRTHVWVKVDNSHSNEVARKAGQILTDIVNTSKEVAKMEWDARSGNEPRKFSNFESAIAKTKLLAEEKILANGNPTVDNLIRSMLSRGEVRGRKFKKKDGYTLNEEALLELENEIKLYQQDLKKWLEHGEPALPLTGENYDTKKASKRIKEAGLPEEFWWVGGFNKNPQVIFQFDEKDSSYYSHGDGDLREVVVNYENATPWMVKRNIIHELGHWHHHNTGRVTDYQIDEEVKKYFDVTKEEMKKPVFKKYKTRDLKFISKTDSIKAKNLTKGACFDNTGEYSTEAACRNLIKDAKLDIDFDSLNEEERKNLKEEALACLDVMMATNPMYGYGHGFNYYVSDMYVFAKTNDDDTDINRYAEWYAHSAEHVNHEPNRFIQALMPKTAANYEKMWKGIYEKQRKFKAKYKEHYG